jgi:glycosyltransferase involved in cell wall biosynthesis
MNKILSIVIPSYNKEKQLQRLLDSIVKSTSFDDTIEIIVSDDCSTDNTKEAIKPYLDNFQNIIYILPEKNGGVHTARNLGMKKAIGEYIGFIDGDDWFTEDGLNIILEDIKQYKDYDILYFPYLTSDNNEKTGYKRTGAITLKELYNSKGLFKKNKNGFAIVRNKIIKENQIQWYYTNLDSLFWRECEYYAFQQSIYVIDHIVGIYDKGTEGSLSKKRNDINHLKKIADIKIKKTLEFLNRLNNFFQKSNDISCQQLKYLKNDIIVAKYKKEHLKNIELLLLNFKCSKFLLFELKYTPLWYFQVKLKLKNFLKSIVK